MTIGGAAPAVGMSERGCMNRMAVYGDDIEAVVACVIQPGGMERGIGVGWLVGDAPMLRA